MQNEFSIVRDFVSSSDVVDMRALFERLGVGYREAPLSNGVSGCIERKNGRFIVTVDSNEGPQRKRFTAAHELGHYLLHRDMLKDRKRLHRDSLFGVTADKNPPSPFRPVHEVQANRFAADLLMPASKIKKFYDPTRNNSRALAERFQVSPSAMDIRLKSLGLLPDQRLVTNG